MTCLDHVGLVVSSIEKTCARQGLAFDPGAIEEFPREGTRELYLGEPGQAARLLLLQPLDAAADGPYARALRKRGEGLHHLALHVPDVAACVQALAPHWQEHPTAPGPARWLFRRGVGCLLEVYAGKAAGGAPYVEAVQVPCVDDDGAARLQALGLPAVQAGEAALQIAGRTLRWAGP